MNILVTGAKGFAGKNLCAQLKNIKDGKARCYGDLVIDEVFEYDIDSTPEDLDDYCQKADFVFNLAGVNRPKDQSEFMAGNFGFASTLLDTLKKHRNTCPVMLSSSQQASLTGRFGNSEYGRSKKAGEDLFLVYGEEVGAKVLIYRFPNLFGKWCRPNYNSAVATFCYNTANGLPIQVNDSSVKMCLVYIDDIVEEMIQAVRGKANKLADGYCKVPVEHECTLGWISDTITSFAGLNRDLAVPDLSDPLTTKLYATYLSYLPSDSLSYSLNIKSDDRGSFTEVIRTLDRGQFSVNVLHPGQTKGKHWHNTKSEKFLVVSGEALIKLRRIGTDPDCRAFPVIEYYVSGDDPKVVQIIPGYTHSITNLSDSHDLVTFMWASESFDPAKPDTFSQEV